LQNKEENKVKSKLTILMVLCVYSMSAQPAVAGKGMATIKGGSYLPLYSADTQRITLRAFNMDIYPVTNADYLLFLSKYPEWSRRKVKSLFADSSYLNHWITDSSFNNNIMNSPVVNVSWFAAKKYCECNGKRLPKVAEWELVARSNEKSADASKDKEFNQWVLNWVSKPTAKVLPNVGTTFKNYYGVYDMHGLVWEWTYDFNSALTTGESRGNSSLDNTFFCGGGSFDSKDINNYASFMRFAMRSSVKANYCVPNIGFRCVK
jgi:formylglycine-generating enzyme required for sulfatase activity